MGQCVGLNCRLALLLTLFACHGAVAQYTPCGTERFIHRGVSVRSNGLNAPSLDSCGGRGTYGLQYQCVEYAKRFSGQALGLSSKGWTGDAYYYFTKAGINQTGMTASQNNNTSEMPKEDDLLVFGPTNTNPAGHIAVIRLVEPAITLDGAPLPGTWRVYLAEQNWDPFTAPQLTVRLNPVTNHYYFEPRVARYSTYTVLGWLRNASAPPVTTITTVAGNGIAGFSGDGGPATAASLWYPRLGAVDQSGSVFIADAYNYRIRKVASNGVITTVAGNGVQGFGGDGGLATSASFGGPEDVAFDMAGNYYIADYTYSRVRKVSTSGFITTVAGSSSNQGFGGDGGPATSALLGGPAAVAVDSSGSLFIAEYANQRIRKVAPNGIITTVAGNGVQGFSGDGGPATSASLNLPWDVAVDASGNVYIADYQNHRIRKVAPNGVISTVAGNGVQGFSGDGGQAVSASLSYPGGIALDAGGNLYIADTANNRVRRVSPNGTITTIAGNGSNVFGGDGGPPTSAGLAFPFKLAIDSAGSLYIADFHHHRIRKVTGL